MKEVIYILLLTVNLSNAQTIEERPIETFYEPNRPNHVYFKDVNQLLNQYLGTWIFNDGTHYFKITFFKQENKRMTPIANTKITYFTDRIYGYYQYKLNGVEIYNVTNDNFAYGGMGAFTQEGFFIFFNEPTKNECGKSKSGKVYLTHSNNNGVQQLNWIMTSTKDITTCYPFDETPLKTPLNMVLTKL